MGWQGRSLTVPLLHRLDEIAADAAGAMSDVDDDMADVPKGVLATLAAAIQSAGPDHVLDTLPLHLEEVLGTSVFACCRYCMHPGSPSCVRCVAAKLVFHRPLTGSRPTFGGQGLNGSGEPRTWLLPLIRQHTSGASLAYWCTQLLPTARACGASTISVVPNCTHNMLTSVDLPHLSQEAKISGKPAVI